MVYLSCVQRSSQSPLASTGGETRFSEGHEKGVEVKAQAAGQPIGKNRAPEALSASPPAAPAGPGTGPPPTRSCVSLARGLAPMLGGALALAGLNLASSPLRAGDDLATTHEAPAAATWPLRRLTANEERALQPASLFKECAFCPDMVV